MPCSILTSYKRWRMPTNWPYARWFYSIRCYTYCMRRASRYLWASIYCRSLTSRSRCSRINCSFSAITYSTRLSCWSSSSPRRSALVRRSLISAICSSSARKLSVSNASFWCNSCSDSCELCNCNSRVEMVLLFSASMSNRIWIYDYISFFWRYSYY